jgi:hypothetical protein
MDRQTSQEKLTEILTDMPDRIWSSVLTILVASTLCWNGLARSQLDFMGPSLKAWRLFWDAEERILAEKSFQEDVTDFANFLRENFLLAEKTLLNAREQILDYHLYEYLEFMTSWLNTLSGDFHGSID